MEEIKKSGNRIYICNTTAVVPNIEEIINSSEQCKLFINSVTLNPKNVNAELYSQFTEDTFHIFMYAFAVQFGQIRTTNSVSSQFEMNARRLERLCKRRKISLSNTELMVIDLCKNFSSLKSIYSEQIDLAEQLKSELAKTYL